MKTRLTDKIYVEKEAFENEYKQAWGKFLAGDTTTEFEEAYKKVEKILNNAGNGWVEMEDDWVYDDKIEACWLGLCSDSYTRKSYLEFETGTELDDALEKLKEHHKTKQAFDLPTKEELSKSLTQISYAPFLTSRERPDKTGEYIIYKKGEIFEKDKLQGFDTDNGYLSDSNRVSKAIPMLRLKWDSSLENNSFGGIMSSIASALSIAFQRLSKKKKRCTFSFHSP